MLLRLLLSVRYQLHIHSNKVNFPPHSLQVTTPTGLIKQLQDNTRLASSICSYTLQVYSNFLVFSSVTQVSLAPLSFCILYCQLWYVTLSFCVRVLYGFRPFFGSLPFQTSGMKLKFVLRWRTVHL